MSEDNQEQQAELIQKTQALQQNKVPQSQLYSTIWDLGKAEYLPAKPVIERYLTHDNDEIRIAALQVIVGRFAARDRKYWEMARDLLTDDDSGNRIDGTSLLGTFKRNTQDEETLRLLAPLVSNTQENPIVRRSAYAAMCGIIHFVPLELWKYTSSDFNLEQDADWELVDRYQSDT
ncbi:MAG: HEAT repeat domain-containing protein [Ktedonobacteraceae bacterium]